MKRLEYDLLFRWFVGLGVDDPAWDPTTFSKNRDRLLEGDVARKFLAAIVAHPKVKRLLSTEHFSVDGTLIEAWASMKSFRPKDGSGDPPGPGRNSERDFHGEEPSNATHQSTTDPDARLYRKGAGREARLCFMGHALMENRNGLVVDGCLTPAAPPAARVTRPARSSVSASRGVRLDQVRRWASQDPPQRPGSCRMAVHLHPGGLQPDQTTQTARLTGGDTPPEIVCRSAGPSRARWKHPQRRFKPMIRPRRAASASC